MVWNRLSVLIVLLFVVACTQKETKPVQVEELSYTDLKEGQGKIVQMDQVLKVHYIGELSDGKVYDDTYKKNSPLEFRLGSGQVIQGLEDGILGMKVGGMREIKIPARLAYGDKGLSNVVPPATLIKLKVELLEVSK